MKLSTQIKPISYLKSHTAQIVKELSESREPMVITQNGEATLVVIDVKSYEERENTLRCSSFWRWATAKLSSGNSGMPKRYLPTWTRQTCNEGRYSGVG